MEPAKITSKSKLPESSVRLSFFSIIFIGRERPRDPGCVGGTDLFPFTLSGSPEFTSFKSCSKLLRQSWRQDCPNLDLRLFVSNVTKIQYEISLTSQGSHWRCENANSREYLESLTQQTREMLRMVACSPSVQMTDTGTEGDSDLDHPKPRLNKWSKVQDDEIETNNK